MGKIFSPGKLLLTSEYVVLDGALALALPTRWGQEFFYEETAEADSCISWTAFHQGELWLECTIDYKAQTVQRANHPQGAEFVLKVLSEAKKLSPKRFSGKSYAVRTNLQFPADYGLGSSSTLMVNVAQWAGVDPFLLNENCLGGSGYDIAVALEKVPLLYQLQPGKRLVEIINFSPVFKDQLLFVHLNQKQNSREGIQHYRARKSDPSLIAQFSELTSNILNTANAEDFGSLLTSHENLLSRFLELPTIKEKYFADCPVFVKSLGAWGGDFVLTADFEGATDYFLRKGFPTVYRWPEIIL